MRHVELPAEPRSVAAARHFVGDLDLPEPPRENAELLVSELVTNAVEHADLASDEAISVRAARTARLRVEVSHRGRGFATRRRTRPAEEQGGWGLPIVDALADDWGVAGAGGKTCVWFTIPIEPVHPRVAAGSYLNCPRCALSIRVRASCLAIDNCPRCLARSRLSVPLYQTPRPVRPHFFQHLSDTTDRG